MNGDDASRLASSPLTSMADITQTDVSRPSALPSARLRPSASQSQSIFEQSSDEYLDFIEEEWNKKIDVEVETLVDGMVDIVNLASVSFNNRRFYTFCCIDICCLDRRQG